MTANVALWPMPMTVVISRQAYVELSPTQQQALRQAVADPEFARDYRFVAELEDENIDVVCRAGTNFLQATPAQLTALQAAVRPVYDAIERGVGNRGALHRIEQLKGDGQPDVLSCAGRETPGSESGQAAGQLDGTYRTSFREKELAESPLMDAGELNDENWGDHTLRLSNGHFHWTQRNDRASSQFSGRYATDGDKITFTVETGESGTVRWSLYRGTLKFERDETLGGAPTPLVLKPWRRVR